MASPAYDLSLYEKNNKRKRVLTVVETKQKEKAQISQKISRVLGIKVCGIAAVILAFASLVIYSQVVLTEINEDITKASEKLTIVQSESTRLTSKIDAKFSQAQIEEAALNLGLSPTQKYQIEYVALSSGDKVVVGAQDDVSWFDKIWEYFS